MFNGGTIRILLNLSGIAAPPRRVVCLPGRERRDKHRDGDAAGKLAVGGPRRNAGRPVFLKA
jgi:hypothetical protein